MKFALLGEFNGRLNLSSHSLQDEQGLLEVAFIRIVQTDEELDLRGAQAFTEFILEGSERVEGVFLQV